MLTRMKRSKQPTKTALRVRKWGRVWIYLNETQKDMVTFAAEIYSSKIKHSASSWCGVVINEYTDSKYDLVSREKTPHRISRRRAYGDHKEQILVYLSPEEFNRFNKVASSMGFSKSTLAADLVVDKAEEVVRMYNQAVAKSQDKVTDDLRKQIESGRVPEWLQKALEKSLKL